MLLSGDELSTAIDHSREHPDVLLRLVASAACGYISVSFVLLLIKLCKLPSRSAAVPPRTAAAAQLRRHAQLPRAHSLRAAARLEPCCPP